ncbi:MAG: FKBP-type peptidyl-prolyl cis-trans isomerase [Gammaproteobacteria bacterium]|nr:FKBP-type peptidyl-prolyl cis-trans isomerase [Gammaproteobacteria bacterium]
MSDQRITRNKAVQFTYTISDDEGNVVEQVDLPVNYVHGASSMGLIESVERALTGCRSGDKIQVDVPPAEGFGEVDPSLTFTDDVENVPPQFRQLGARVEMQNDQGETKEFVVSKIEDGKLTIDGNHPLAGKTAKFSVTVLSVRDATADEIRNGIANPDVNMPLH